MAGPDPARAERLPTIRVGGFLGVDGKVLMVQQGRGDERYWLLPGGGVRFGEPLAHALIRETQEELGLRVAVGPLLAIVESISPEPDYEKHVVHLIFDVSAAPEADLTPLDAAVLGARFLSETEILAADVRPPISEFLTACLRERPSSPQYLGRRW
jgi:ADP-ribose pyrophosphatase YjhB (NUDIX family)